MFGNRLGWGISAAIALLMGYVVYLVIGLNAISPPSRGVIMKAGNYSLNLLDKPQMLEPLTLPFSPTSVLPSMTKVEDSAVHYRKAMDEFKKDRYRYDTRTKLKSTDLNDYPAVKFIIDGKDGNSANLFLARPEDVISYASEPEPLKALQELGKCMEQLSLLSDKKEDSLLLGEAMFSLGVKLYQERLRWYEFDIGYNLIHKGCYMIGKHDPSRKAAATEASTSLSKYIKERCMPMAAALTSIDSAVMGRTAGDIFYMVKNSKERLWRIEGTLKLGHYKFNSGEPGRGADQRGAKIWVRRISKDASEDTYVKTAAKSALELTLEQYRMIGS